MSNKTYSRARDAAKAARKNIGSHALIDVHFKVTPTEDGKFAWVAIEGAPDVEIAAAAAHEEKKLMEVEKLPKRRKPKAKAKAKPKAKVAKVAKAPAVIRRYLKGRKTADTVIGKRHDLVQMVVSRYGTKLKTICKTLGWLPHTVRGAVSTLKSEGVIKNLKSYKDHDGDRRYSAKPVKRVA